MIQEVLFTVFLAFPAASSAAQDAATENHAESISKYSSLSRTAVSPYSNSPEKVAAALGVSVKIARDAQARNLDEMLGWRLMLMAKQGGCSVAVLTERRKAMSWAEVAISAGYTWVSLTADLDAKLEAAGIEPGEPSFEQILRSISNDPDSGIKS